MTRDILLQDGSGGFFRPCTFVFGKLALEAIISFGHLKWRGFKIHENLYTLARKMGLFLLEIFQSNFDENGSCMLGSWH